jgi:hypothetical protein
VIFPFKFPVQGEGLLPLPKAIVFITPTTALARLSPSANEVSQAKTAPDLQKSFLSAKALP